jgi:hypothetical protein
MSTRPTGWSAGVLRDLAWDRLHGRSRPAPPRDLPETATAVAVRLLADDRIEVVAPCGLEDLFGLVCRRNPRRVTVEHYRQRVHDKRIAERWPRVEVLW